VTSNIAGKSIGSAIKSLLTSEYKFLGGDKVQEMFVRDVMKLFKEYNRDSWNLEPGQTMWFAVCADEKQGYGKPLEKTRITPVILSVVHDEDRKTRENGYSHKELRKFKVARLLREAYEQKGVLSQADVAEMLGVSTGTISKDIKEYQIENQVVLPYRGTIHDLGRAITHKKIIIGHFLKNVPTPDIARITGHTEEACDRYIKAFKKVRTLHESMNHQEIARTLDMSEFLVKEYIAIIEEFNKKEEKVNDGSS
jgi:DNA-binding XRE family transcriptional regulator